VGHLVVAQEAVAVAAASMAVVTLVVGAAVPITHRPLRVRSPWMTSSALRIASNAVVMAVVDLVQVASAGALAARQDLAQPPAFLREASNEHTKFNNFFTEDDKEKHCDAA
jgi:hypothetical protein